MTDKSSLLQSTDVIQQWLQCVSRDYKATWPTV